MKAIFGDDPDGWSQWMPADAEVEIDEPGEYDTEERRVIRTRGQRITWTTEIRIRPVP